jgi:cytochrome P450
VKSIIYPPGPRERFPGELLLAFNHDSTGFLSRLAREYGDLSSFRAGWLRVAFVNHPDLIRDVLVTHHRNFIQGPGHQKAKRLAPNALFAADGEAHLLKRRLVQPVFHRRHIHSFGTVITDFAARHCEQWQEGQTLDMAHEMWRLALRITAKTLFSTSVEHEAEELSRTVDELFDMVNPLLILFAEWLLRVPNPIKRRYQAASARLDEKFYHLIREHQATGDRGDVLSMLLSAHVGPDGDGHLSEAEVRDEALEIFLAGHGTIALALGWTLYLLAQHPNVEERLLAELKAVLGDRCPTGEDVERLTYTRMVLQESMRLYPPSWVMDRELVRDYELGGYHLPAGSIVLLSPWATHRDARYFPDPSRFDPERWMPGQKVNVAEFAYFPFGGGPHRCLGESLAWYEGILILATILPRWRMHLLPQPRVELKPRFSLETKNGIPMRLERRDSVGSTG